jgi:hypothetical protein
MEIVSTKSVSPGSTYTVTAVQAMGDGGEEFSIKDKTGKVILDNTPIEVDATKLPGYKSQWGCMCGGLDFKGWSSDRYIITEWRAQSMPDGAKALYYHLAVDASTGKVLPETLKLDHEE